MGSYQDSDFILYVTPSVDTNTIYEADLCGLYSNTVVLNLYLLFNFNEFPFLPNKKKRVEYMWSIMISLLRIYNNSQSFGIKGFVVDIVF